MIFFLFIALVILLTAIYNYKRGFLSFLVYRLILVTNITLISRPGLPLLSLDVFMVLAFVGLYCLRRKKIKRTFDPIPFPYAKAYGYIAIAYLVSTIFAIVGFTGAFSAYIKTMLNEVITAWLIWKIVKREDLAFLLKGITVMIFLSCLYCFYEKLTVTNPLMEYEITLVQDEDKAIDFSYSEYGQRGYRCQSFFEHAIGAGLNWAMFIIFYLTLIYTYKMRIPKSQGMISLVTMLFCIPCLLFTSSRAPIFFFFVYLLSFVNVNSVRFFRALVVVAVCFIVFLPLLSSFTNVDLITSMFFSSNAQDEVGGSDAGMRLVQLATSAQIMMMSPIIGLGYKFQEVLDTSLTSDLLGMESIWFSTLTQFGLLGAAVNLFLAYVSIIKIPRMYKSRPAMFLSLAYWLTASLTSVPGMSMSFYFILLTFFLKFGEVYQEKTEQLYQFYEELQYGRRIDSDCLHEQSQEPVSLPKQH